MWFYFSLYIIATVLTILTFNKIKKCNFNKYLNREIRMGFYLNLLYCLFIIVLIIIASCRYRIGTDYGLYEKGYNGISHSGWLNIEFNGLFKVLIDFFNMLGFSYQEFITFFAIFTLGIFATVFYKYSINPFGSVLTLIGLSYFTFGMNSFRQFFAVSLVLYATILFGRKLGYKKISLKAIVIVAIAVGIHNSALYASIIILLISFWKLRSKRIRILNFIGIILCCVTRAMLPLVNKCIGFITLHMGIYSSYANYSGDNYYRFYSQGTSAYNLLLLIPNLIIIYYMVKDYETNKFYLKSFEKILIKVYYFTQLFYCLNMNSEMIIRFTVYFSITTVLMYPLLIKYLHWKCGKSIAFVMLLILILAMGFMFWRNLSNNVYGILPYTSIFNKYGM